MVRYGTGQIPDSARCDTNTQTNKHQIKAVWTLVNARRYWSNVFCIATGIKITWTLIKITLGSSVIIVKLKNPSSCKIVSDPPTPIFSNYFFWILPMLSLKIRTPDSMFTDCTYMYMYMYVQY